MFRASAPYCVMYKYSINYNLYSYEIREAVSVLRVVLGQITRNF